MKTENKEVKRLRPIKKNILVRLDARETVSEGGIHIPSKAQRAEEWGEVVRTGELCQHISVGDRVLVKSTQGTHYRHEGTDMIVVNESVIIGFEPAGAVTPTEPGMVV